MVFKLNICVQVVCNHRLDNRVSIASKFTVLVM